jgi:gluconokinase
MRIVGPGWTRSRLDRQDAPFGWAHGVIACSALTRGYRDVLIGDRADVPLVYLKVDEGLSRVASPPVARILSALLDHQ